MISSFLVFEIEQRNQNDLDYMTESPGNEPGSTLFARIQQMVAERGVDIRSSQNGNAMRLDFADGQRILINFDDRTFNVWLAARTGGIEFLYLNGRWLAHNQSDFFVKLRETMEFTIASNPLNARAPGTQSLHPSPTTHLETGESHGLRNVLLLVLAGAIGFWAAQKLSLPEQTANADPRMLALSQLDPNHQCEALIPPNGNITVFPGSGLQVDSPNNPEITLKNDHTHPVLLILSAPQTAVPSLSVLVRAKQSATLHLPAGQYDMMFSAGSKWCNPRRGFSEGNLVKFDKPLAVEVDKPVQLALQTSGAGMGDFQLFIKTANLEASLPPPTFSGDGSMEVQRQANGHFYVPGTIDKTPATFMVDTGASVTSISSDLARQVGIYNCKEVQFQTANGAATGCIALVQHMTLGNFVLENTTVAVMPNLETNLLGANVLRNFQISQNENSMLLRRR
jgi:clan AA aspartic protease (TIGR02281 family)